MKKLSIFKEFLTFLKVSRNWWITPIIVVFFVVGAVLVLSHGSALAPVIYTMF